MTALILYTPGRMPRPVPAAEAEAEAVDLAHTWPGKNIYILTPEQAQLLSACDPDAHKAFLGREDVVSVAVPPPVPLWEHRHRLALMVAEAEALPQVVS